MMNRENAFLKIKSIIFNVACVPDDEIVSEAHLFDDLGIDSLDFTAIVMEVEEFFETHCLDSLWDRLATVDDLVDVALGNKPSSGKKISNIMLDFDGGLLSTI